MARTPQRTTLTFDAEDLLRLCQAMRSAKPFPVVSDAEDQASHAALMTRLLKALERVDP